MSDQTLYGGPIVTGEAVAVELRPAGVGSRGVALAIDLAVQYGLILLLALVTSNVFGAVDSAAGEALLVLAFVGIVLGYPVGFESLWRGRTLGKAAMGLRVVRDDGGPIRFRHAFVRGLVGVVVDKPGLSLSLLALVPMLVTARSKRLGDFAAGTVVVQERVPAQVVAPPPMPPGLERWAAGLDLTGVTDDLALETRQFMSRAGQLAPWARDQIGARLYHELVTRTGAPPAGVPPGTYLTAVLAERRRREIDRLTPTAAQPTSTAQEPAAADPPRPEPPRREPPGPFAPPG